MVWQYCFAVAWVGFAVAIEGPHIFDAGEIVVAAHQLGASHAPGQVLHALLGYALTLVPLGPISFRIACLSALAAGLALFEASRLMDALTEQHQKSTKLIKIAALLSVTLQTAFLAQAYRPEVYTLALWLFLYAVRNSLSGQTPWSLCLMGALWTLHPAYALSLGLWLLCSQPDLIARLERWPVAALALLTGLGVWIYLPLRSLAGAPMWGNPTTFAGLWRYITASDYRQNINYADGFLDALAQHFIFAMKDVGAVIPLLAIVIAIITRSHLRYLLCAVALLLPAALQPLVEYNPDNIAYALPFAFLILTTSAAALTHHAQKLIPQRLRVFVISVFALSAVSWTFFGHRKAIAEMASDIKHSKALESLGFAQTQIIEPTGFVLSTSDFFSATWMLEQRVEGMRPDVTVMISGLATSSWHWKDISLHPCLTSGPIPASRVSDFEPAAQRYIRGALQRVYRCAPIVIEELSVVPLQSAWSTVALAGCPDHSLAGNILRHQEVMNMQELVRESRFDEATSSMKRLLCGLPHSELNQITLSRFDEKRVPPLVKANDTHLESFEDAVRQVSVYLWASGDAPGAQRLLQAQLGRGDALSLLQLAWFYLSMGNKDGARASLHAFSTLNPSPQSQKLAQDLQAAIEMNR